MVIAGDDKDLKTPRTVLAVFTDEKKPRVLVEGVRIVTKHKKPNAQSPQGAIVKEEAPIAISNVMLFDSKAGTGSRIKRERKDGKAVRITKKSNEVIK